MPDDAGTPRPDPVDPPRVHHRLHTPAIGPGPLVVSGEEAHHAARVKRLRPGELVEVFDGRGTAVVGRVSAIAGSRQHPEIEVEPAGAPRRVPPVFPRIEVWCPAPKGDRLERMLDQLSQIGVACWRPLACERAEDNLPKKPDRLLRVAIESAKQCGRAHLLELGPGAGLDDAIGRPGTVAAYQGGAPGRPEPDASGTLTLLVGPEGGWSEGEVRRLRDGAVPLLVLGPHVLRLETAAAVGAAALIAGFHREDTP